MAEVLEDFDNFAGLRNGLRRAAGLRDQWAGIPMPIEGENLVVEPSHPYAIPLEAMTRKHDDEPEVTVRNSFYSRRHRVTVYVWEEPDGSIAHGLDWSKKIDAELHTMGVSVAWGIEQEHRALQTLGQRLDHHRLKQYLLTGMFIETSGRSGVKYLFRKLRPTVALRFSGDRVRVLAALCMHPIAYYEGSWAGAMCPTDDVLAHLMLMRGDEAMFWKRCNQHPPYRPESGV